MLPASRSDGQLNLNYIPTSQSMSSTSTGNVSPSETVTAGAVKSPFGLSNGVNTGAGSMGSARLGAGSPSHDLGTRLYSKRAREIQAQERASPSYWGPPTSGHSTPLRENIPESPNHDGFPDLVPASEVNMNGPARRARAGTVPSKFPAVGNPNGTNVQQPFLSKTSRPSPSTSPFQPVGISAVDSGAKPSVSAVGASSSVPSRLRAGSMPQRASLLGTSSPFGPSLFSTAWSTGRERAITLSSIKSSDGPTSPSHSTFSKDGLADGDVKTLDYLGLAETPQHAGPGLSKQTIDLLLQQQQQQQQQASALPPMLAELAMMKNSNRFRSYSVNAKEKYAEDDELDYETRYSQLPSGTLTPSAAATAAQLAATQAQIHQHNLAVQAFASHASASRPRARTAGILDTPHQRSSIRNYLATPSRLENSISAADLHFAESGEYDELSEAVQMLHLGGSTAVDPVRRPATGIAEDGNQDGPTRALWIGSVPVSTTVTSLEAIFGVYGKIESTRVLTHKNCGFVNFERIDSAIQAKSLLNGKEIFPGSGPVRIGYAKVPATSASGTPGANGARSSEASDSGFRTDDVLVEGVSSSASVAATAPQIRPLADLKSEMAQFVNGLGATEEDSVDIMASVQRAISYQDFEDEIVPVAEASQTKIFDAPRLRDIRKRIDNGVFSIREFEETANDMLPEIAELSSDYLGNTVVQKLFEYCTEETKEQMLAHIAPHLAEFGVHKNGTWAAQKIIDVTKSPIQMRMIVNALRPYTVSLFLDQYGNYVLQCCLRFGSPYNDFIFETMLSRMWEIAQGRFGARAMRACLESHHASKNQQRMLAAAIALYSVQLATNANGALLLTWFLDTCTFSRRRTVLAPRLVPHLVHLCTHKVAYLSVLKVINQRNEPEAREIILKALFFSPGDGVLESILSDQASGATLIFKVLTTPFFDEAMRADVVKNISKVLTKIKAQPHQGYKRLMDEVGLSSRGSGRDYHHVRDHGPGHGPNGPKPQHRPTPRQGSMSYPSQTGMERQTGGHFPPARHAQNLDNTRPMSSDQQAPPSAFDPYAVSNLSSTAGLTTINGIGTINSASFSQDALIAQQQLQYQAYLAAQSRGIPPAGIYPSLASANFAYPPGTSSVDSLRSLQNQNTTLAATPTQLGAGPILNPSAYAPGQQFSVAPAPAQMYQYPPPFYSATHMAQGQPAGGRRGRR